MSTLPAKPEEVVISDSVAARIAPKIKRNGRAYEGRNEAETRRAAVSGLLPEEMRRMRAFLVPYKRSHCDYRSWEENNGKAYDAVEVVKTLLMTGEMDTVFRICAHPDNDYLRWWRTVDCMSEPCTCNGRGWSSIVRAALKSYICLNMLYCYPELWDAESGRNEEKDYRNTRCYQKTLIDTCMDIHWHSPRGNSLMPYLPHQEFFGIANDEPPWYPGFVDTHRWNPKPGLLEIEMFLHVNREGTHLHTATDVSEVLALLRSKGLPDELSLRVLKLAEYRPRRRALGVPRDPLHPQNYEELRKYLTYCWVLLLRSDMLATKLGDIIPWKRLVGTCIVELLGNTSECRGKMYTVFEPWEDLWHYRHPDSTIAREDRFDQEYQFK